MILPPPRSTLTDTLFHYTTLCRACPIRQHWRQRRSGLIRRLSRSGEASGWGENDAGSEAGRNSRADRKGPRRFDLADGRSGADRQIRRRSEEHTSELQSLMRLSYAVFCLKNNKLPIKEVHIT